MTWTFETDNSSRRFAWAAVIALFLAVYLGSAFSPALQDDVDTSHAEAAREMLTRGDFVTLHINGVRYLEKAPADVLAGRRIVPRLRHPRLCRPPAHRAAMFLMVLLGIAWGGRAFGRVPGFTPGSSPPPVLDIFSSPACSSRRQFSASSSPPRSIAWSPPLPVPTRAGVGTPDTPCWRSPCSPRACLRWSSSDSPCSPISPLPASGAAGASSISSAACSCSSPSRLPGTFSPVCAIPASQPSRLLLVLLRQRALPALPRQAHSQGLQQAPRLISIGPFTWSGSFPGALSAARFRRLVAGCCAARMTPSATLANVEARPRFPHRTRWSAPLGLVTLAVFRLLHQSGVLHLPRLSRVPLLLAAAVAGEDDADGPGQAVGCWPPRRSASPCA